MNYDNNTITNVNEFKIRFRNAVIELTAVEPGVFEVTGRVLGVAMDKVELVFQVRNNCMIFSVMICLISAHRIFSSYNTRASL